MQRAERDDLVGVTVYREDLRQLLVAADLYSAIMRDEGKDPARLEQAINRVGSTAEAGEWNPPGS